MVLAFGLFIHIDVVSTTLELVIFQIIAGVGTGTCYSSPLIALQAQANPEDTATVTSTWGFVRNLSNAISVVIGGVVFQNGMESQAGFLAEKLGKSIAMRLSGKNAAANVLMLKDLSEAQGYIARSAYATSLKQMWIVFTCTATCALIASAFIRKNVLSEVHQESRMGLHKEGGTKSTGRKGVRKQGSSGLQPRSI